MYIKKYIFIFIFYRFFFLFYQNLIQSHSIYYTLNSSPLYLIYELELPSPNV